jgi:hypothetical protein
MVHMERRRRRARLAVTQGARVRAATAHASAPSREARENACAPLAGAARAAV